MEELIPIINRLHDAFSVVEGGGPLDLPQIVVIGSQSSGKSSVLENIVGKDFLPRGSGIVTRRPLVLQLINIPKKKINNEINKQNEEWGEFMHLKNEKIYDFHKIRDEISKETERITGKNKGVSELPINLKIYSPNVLNLTLVDLPGVTKVPVGDQPKDIELQIRKMVLHYIEKPNTIILAITAANTDLSNSDALHLARLVDPEGKRTLGVITKLDLMDKGTDALDMLLGKVIPLKLGYIGVVNRSQQDINENKSIQEALIYEENFFKNSPIYNQIRNKCGTKYLSLSLNKLLINHIKDCLPDLKAKLHQNIQAKQEELKSYGDNLVNYGALLLQIINNFSSLYEAMIDGKLTDNLSTDELYGGARINYIFNEVFSKYLSQLNPLEDLSPIDIKTAISNTTGPKAALFVPEAAFELLVRRQLAKLREPSLQCVDLVYDELERIIHSINFVELDRFQNLKVELIESATNLLRNCKIPSKEMISNLHNMELCFINTNHPDFQIDQIIAGVMQRRQQSQQVKQLQPQSTQQQIQQDQNQQQQQQQQYQISTQNKNIKDQQRKSQTIVSNQQISPTTNDSSLDNKGFLNYFFGPKKESNTNNSNNINNNKNTSVVMKPSSQIQKSEHLKLQQVPTTLNITSISGQKDFEIELLESLLCEYFNISRKNFQDLVPKTIMYLMIMKSKTEMQNELVQKLYKEQSFENLFNENPQIVQKRKLCKETLDLLYKAQTILNEIRDFATPNSILQ